MSTVSKLIKSTPGILRKNIYFLIPFKYRYNKIYRKTLKVINKSQWWNSDKLLEYQLDQLKMLCYHAYENVPYYRKIFDDLDLHPTEFNSIEDLKYLPILTKDIIKENYDLLIAKNINDYPISFSTSGSTGTPFQFEGVDSMYKKEAAFITRSYNSHGSKLYTEKSIWIRRYQPEKNQPIQRYDYELNRMYLSPFHITKDNAQKYVDLINNYGAKQLNGYPSSIYILARILDETGLQLNNIKKIHCASEKMLNEWDVYIKKVMGITPKNHYGMVEKVAHHNQCEKTNYYHDNLEYGVTEFISEEGLDNIVVGTSFLNYRMPFIRYKMNDTALINEGNKQCECGRGLPLRVKDFLGRSDDLLISEKGALVPSPNFYTMMYKIPGVDMFKIIQEIDTSINIIVTKFENFDKNSEKMIISGMKERLGDLKIKLEVVPEIKRSKKTGKIRCIINKGKN